MKQVDKSGKMTATKHMLSHKSDNYGDDVWGKETQVNVITSIHTLRCLTSFVLHRTEHKKSAIVQHARFWL